MVVRENISYRLLVQRQQFKYVFSNIHYFIALSLFSIIPIRKINRMVKPVDFRDVVHIVTDIGP